MRIAFSILLLLLAAGLALAGFCLPVFFVMVTMIPFGVLVGQEGMDVSLQPWNDVGRAFLGGAGVLTTLALMLLLSRLTTGLAGSRSPSSEWPDGD